jgi:hypothetical protein
MPNYSQAPRGLFVLVDVGRVFTAIAISPSKRLRQLLARDAIRAGRNLPDKELRYRRTVHVCYSPTESGDPTISVGFLISLQGSDYIIPELNRDPTYSL